MTNDGSLETFNKVLRPISQPSKTFENNYEFWRNEYTFDQIIEAIPDTQSQIFGQAATPGDIRRSNTRGEVANYISDFTEFERENTITIKYAASWKCCFGYFKTKVMTKQIVKLTILKVVSVSRNRNEK